MKKRTMYEIREYTKKSPFSVSLSHKLKTRQRAIKIISRFTWKTDREIFMSPIEILV